MSKNTVPIRVRKEEKEKMLKVARELSMIEEKEIRNAEVMRRISNIPNVKEILIKDAKLKRRLKEQIK